jgi:hypothetical protein
LFLISSSPSIITYLKANPNFWAIKCCVPHCFHGRDKEGRIVIYQKPSDMKLWILESMGLTQEHFVKHYIFLEEYLARVSIWRENKIKIHTPLLCMLFILLCVCLFLPFSLSPLSLSSLIRSCVHRHHSHTCEFNIYIYIYIITS